MLRTVLEFLASKQMVVLMLCVGLGFLLGKIKTKKFPMNATLGTIIVAFAINFLFRATIGETPSIPKILADVFFAMFCFALGYSAGPDFVQSMRTDGFKQMLKQALLSLFYCACTLLCMLALCRAAGLVNPDIVNPGTANGLVAGAQTQSTILNVGGALSDELEGKKLVAYAVCYVIGTVIMIAFVQSIAPRLLKINLRTAVKRFIDEATKKGQFSGPADSVIPTRAIQQRAYRVLPGASVIGKTVDQVEAAGKRRFEIITIHRGNDFLEQDLYQDTRIEADDVLVLVGDARVIYDVRDDHLEETVDSKYLTTELQSAEIVITEPEEKKKLPDIRAAITNRGVLLQDVQRKGQKLGPTDASPIEPGDILHVTGLRLEVEALAKDFGYIKDNGAPSDIPVFTLALVIAALLGSITIGQTPLSTSTFAIPLGMLCGYINQNHPRRAYVSAHALSFIRSLGLNLFIAVQTLNASLDPAILLSTDMLVIMVCGAVLSVVPMLVSLFFGKYVLKLDDIPLLGGLCGCGTSTPALSTLEESTGSTVFTSGYTPAYVVGNILLTVTGIIALRLL